jgi:hypothetical protein
VNRGTAELALHQPGAHHASACQRGHAVLCWEEQFCRGFGDAPACDGRRRCPYNAMLFGGLDGLPQPTWPHQLHMRLGALGCWRARHPGVADGRGTAHKQCPTTSPGPGPAVPSLQARRRLLRHQVTSIRPVMQRLQQPRHEPSPACRHSSCSQHLNSQVQLNRELAAPTRPTYVIATLRIILKLPSDVLPGRTVQAWLPTHQRRDCDTINP